MTATKVRPIEGTLSSLRKLARDKDRMGPAEMLSELIKLRGVNGAIIDVIDGLKLRAEADDVADGDSERV